MLSRRVQLAKINWGHLGLGHLGLSYLGLSYLGLADRAIMLYIGGHRVFGRTNWPRRDQRA